MPRALRRPLAPVVVQAQGDRPVGCLVHGEMRQRQRLQRMRHVDIVDPGAVGLAVAQRRPAGQAAQHHFAAVEGQFGEVAGAVAQQRQAEIEAARDGDFATPTRRHRLAGPVEDFDKQLRLQQHVASPARVEHANRPHFVE